jgi:hypothetical protein
MFKTPTRIAGPLISKIKKRTPEFIKKNLGGKKKSNHETLEQTFELQIQFTIKLSVKLGKDGTGPPPVWSLRGRDFKKQET